LLWIVIFVLIGGGAMSSTSDYISKEIMRIHWGSEAGQLGLWHDGMFYDFPRDFTVTEDESIYFADSYNNRINKYDNQGNYTGEIKLEDAMQKKIIYYKNLDTDGQNIYVFDWKNVNVIKIDKKGELKTVIKNVDGRSGIHMQVNRSGDVIVEGEKSIKKYSRREKQKLFGIFGASGEEYVAEDSNYAYESPGGNVYELEKQNREIRFKRTKKISTGTGIMSAADKTPKDMSFSCDLKKGDRFIGFDNTDNYYVADYRYKHIRKYDPDGNLIVQLELPKNPGIASYRFRIVKVDGKGNIYCFLYDEKEAWIVKMEKGGK